CPVSRTRFLGRRSASRTILTGQQPALTTPWFMVAVFCVFWRSGHLLSAFTTRGGATSETGLAKRLCGPRRRPLGAGASWYVGRKCRRVPTDYRCVLGASSSTRIENTPYEVRSHNCGNRTSQE